MKESLINTELLITDSVNFIKSNVGKYDLHIVSGSDQTELRFLCEQLKISQYFETISGSPAPKSSLIESVISNKQYKKSYCVLIGDSINDLEAAKNSGIDFLGYNNTNLKELGCGYIDLF